jgi:hypothetical protein
VLHLHDKEIDLSLRPTFGNKPQSESLPCPYRAVGNDGGKSKRSVFMNPGVFATLIIGFVLPFAYDVRADGDVRARVKLAIESKVNDDLSDASETEKPSIIAELKRYASENGGKGIFAHAARKELVKLGDGEQIESESRSFVTAKNLREARRAATLLRAARDPKVIAAIAPEMFRDESAAEVYDEVSFEYPRSMQAASVVISVASNSSQLSVAMRQSVKDLQCLKPAGQRLILRRWWTANKPAFAAQNYRAVQPIRR